MNIDIILRKFTAKRGFRHLSAEKETNFIHNPVALLYMTISSYSFLNLRGWSRQTKRHLMGRCNQGQNLLHGFQSQNVPNIVKMYCQQTQKNEQS